MNDLTGTATTCPDHFEQTGHLVLRDVIGTELVEHLAAYAAILRDRGSFQVDDQVPGSLRTYGAAGFETLLASLAPVFSAQLAVELVPTYSFARYYRRGDELFPHRDRPECEHSATVHLAGAADAVWPIWLRDGDGPMVSVDLGPGDALLYRGDRVLHWRDPLDAEWYLQVFLHYVNAAGPFADRAFDGRGAVGIRPGRQDSSELPGSAP
jgi:hypothetical protein